MNLQSWVRKSRDSAVLVLLDVLAPLVDGFGDRRDLTAAVQRYEEPQNVTTLRDGHCLQSAVGLDSVAPQGEVS